MAMGGSKTVVGLDVGSYAVKAVALAGNRDRITLQGYAQARIDNQDVGEVIRKVVEQLGIKPKRVVTSVSGRSVIVRQVETPRLGSDELKAHIAYEADKYIPFGAEEVIIDAQPLPEQPGAEKTPNMQVMLVAVRKSFVQDHLNQLKGAGVAPEVIDVDVFALANAYELLGPAAPPDSDKKATALIDIGASKSNIAIVQGTRVLFTREVYLAGNEISDAIARTFNEPAEDIERIKLAPGETLEALIDAAMPAFEDLANEIRLSFDYVEGQFDMEVSTVVLTGGSSQLPNVADILGNILNRPVHVFDPLAGLDLVPSRYDIHGLDANSPCLTVALGLAAHILNFDQASLGGAQSHNWQPRQGGGEAGSTTGTASRPAPAPAPRPVEPTVVNRPPPVNLAPAPTPLSNQAIHNTPPRPIEIPSAPAAPPQLTPPPLAGAPAGGSSKIIADKYKSGLLVVLDDDQEMPQSEKFERRTGSNTKSSSSLKVENFDEDDKGTDLPELPKI
ncbi:MAG: type IV pilus assembly protein PilM [Planctomycetes bacterium]|nr:type IV pilus assembly protein PilM [Planctomycetota bacterium]